jgi:hypothetical protein
MPGRKRNNLALTMQLQNLWYGEIKLHIVDYFYVASDLIIKYTCHADLTQDIFHVPLF